MSIWKGIMRDLSPTGIASNMRRVFDKDSWKFRNGAPPLALIPPGGDTLAKSVESRIYDYTGMGPSNKPKWVDKVYSPTGFAPSSAGAAGATSSAGVTDYAASTPPVIDLSSRRWLY